ncbi:sugar phosphate isomerase/epimerase family protein [Flavisolibacter ginsenosidimutans]|uniref:Sugar phosphate isomerase/epimerase n=1 Tax=Flavisolibacter ginsenosidimutans TaxID=661481 RepID=A0A5B8UGG9_9BACT|nr:sugar phosphate isomerase/epimerase [Flavisolibacter ginsenosidimutans]QEC55482.1 sugar phosphate isomerase/epimerase [Flavisolibacter ginsenosidimutans]
MTQSRRSFLQNAGLAASGILLSSYLPSCKTAAASKSINQNFGLQLYTLRDDLPKDPKGILTQVASFGYKQIESFEGGQGIFWGMSNTEFKKLMDNLGMTIVSSHCDINKDFERKASEAAAIGMKYLLCPYLGPQKSIDDFKRFADTFNKRGEVCKQNGIRFGYHNHDYGFKPVDGQLPQDVLMQNTDKDLVDFEMDMYWVVTAGQNPSDWYRKYPGRFKLCHVKDRQKGVPLTEKKNVSVVLGTGSINFPSHLKVGVANGLKYFIVEQEAYEGTTPLAATKDDATYMKNVKISA